MSLDDLVGTRQLQIHAASPESLQRLLGAIRCNVAEAHALYDDTLTWLRQRRPELFE